MTHSSPLRTGCAPFRGYETWFMVFGELISGLGEIPLVALHGGPGAGCLTLEVLGKLWAMSGVPVVVYDQVGCGRSTSLEDAPREIFTVEFFLDELENLLTYLGIETYHLLGHSWGGMLGAEHAVRHPVGLQKMILEGSPASMELCMQVRDDTYRSLGQKYYDAVLQYDRDGIPTEDFQGAFELFKTRYLSRTVPFPQVVNEVWQNIMTAYNLCDAMWGLTKILESTGCLKNWSIISRIGQIRNEVLIITGDHDYCGGKSLTPYLNEGINVKMVTFENSGHMVHVDGGDKYLACVLKFLKE